jgi:hypothetical protein
MDAAALAVAAADAVEAEHPASRLAASTNEINLFMVSFPPNLDNYCFHKLKREIPKENSSITIWL